MNTNFKVIGLTQLGIKPESTAQETDALYHSAIRAVSIIMKHSQHYHYKGFFVQSLRFQLRGHLQTFPSDTSGDVVKIGEKWTCSTYTLP